MQHSAQRAISVVPLREMKLLRECLEPNVGFLNGVIQGGHG